MIKDGQPEHGKGETICLVEKIVNDVGINARWFKKGVTKSFPNVV